MPDIDSKYLRGLPSSDPYGDEDGFDMDIDLEWTDEDEYLDAAEKEVRDFKLLEGAVLAEGTAYVNRNEAGYLCCQLDDDYYLLCLDPEKHLAQRDMERRLSEGFELEILEIFLSSLSHSSQTVIMHI